MLGLPGLDGRGRPTAVCAYSSTTFRNNQCVKLDKVWKIARTPLPEAYLGLRF